MKSLFPFAGGKMHLIKYIKEIYGNSNKEALVDVFGGSGKVLMNIDAKVKVYNDIDSSLVNVFETLRRNPEALKAKFHYSINSRELFNDYRDRTDDEAENAFRKIYSYMLSFSGKGNHFGYSVKERGSKIANVKKNIDTIYEEVKYWTIENLDYRDLIKRYDSGDTFFYLDPPYHKIKYYRYNFEEADFYKLKDVLNNIKGKYLININYSEFIIGVFGEPQIKIEVKNNSVNNRHIRDSKRYELFYYN